MSKTAVNVKQVGIELKKIRDDLMFGFVTDLPKWIIGCTHGCTYCYARELCLGRLKNIPNYRAGFGPRVIWTEVNKNMRNRFDEVGKLKPRVVFPFSMGDPFCGGFQFKDLKQFFHIMNARSYMIYLWMSKNPAMYGAFEAYLSPNIIIGTTIESNIPYPYISSAPYQWKRAEAMAALENPNKFVCVEPVMEFDLEAFSKMLLGIGPRWVAVGYDNHGHKLPEPALQKVDLLIGILEKEGITVIRKTLRERWDQNHPLKGG